MLAGVGDRLLGDAQELGLDVGEAGSAASLSVRCTVRSDFAPDLPDVVRQRRAEAVGRGRRRCAGRRSKPQVADHPGQLAAEVAQPCARRVRVAAPCGRRRSRARRPPGRCRRGSPGPAAAARRRWPSCGSRRRPGRCRGACCGRRAHPSGRRRVLGSGDAAPRRPRRRSSGCRPAAAARVRCRASRLPDGTTPCTGSISAQHWSISGSFGVSTCWAPIPR